LAKLPKQVTSLLDRLYDEDIPTIKKSKRLKLGNLYLFGYDAKTKAKLPYWDMLPLVVLFGYKAPYMIGVNAHYIPFTFRVQLLKELNKKMANGNRLKYKDIQRAWKAARIPKGYYYLAIRKYLISHIQTNIKVFEGEDNWAPVAAKVLPKFKKKSNSQVIKDIQRQFREHKAKQNKKKKQKKSK
jgi:hypothetical protein